MRSTVGGWRTTDCARRCCSAASPRPTWPTRQVWTPRRSSGGSVGAFPTGATATPSLPTCRLTRLTCGPPRWPRPRRPTPRRARSSPSTRTAGRCPGCLGSPVRRGRAGDRHPGLQWSVPRRRHRHARAAGAQFPRGALGAAGADPRVEHGPLDADAGAALPRRPSQAVSRLSCAALAVARRRSQPVLLPRHRRRVRRRHVPAAKEHKRGEHHDEEARRSPPRDHEDQGGHRRHSAGDSCAKAPPASRS